MSDGSLFASHLHSCLAQATGSPFLIHDVHIEAKILQTVVHAFTFRSTQYLRNKPHQISEGHNQWHRVQPETCQ